MTRHLENALSDDRIFRKYKCIYLASRLLIEQNNDTLYHFLALFHICESSLRSGFPMGLWVFCATEVTKVISTQLE